MDSGQASFQSEQFGYIERLIRNNKCRASFFVQTLTGVLITMADVHTTAKIQIAATIARAQTPS